MIAHLNDDAYGAERILDAATARDMHAHAMAGIAPLNRMMLGFYEARCNGHRVIAHGGDTQWFHSDLHLFLDDGVGLFVSMNGSGKDGAAAALRRALFGQFCDRYLPGPTLDGRQGHVDRGDARSGRLPRRGHDMRVPACRGRRRVDHV